MSADRKRILVAVDGSSQSSRMIGYASRLLPLDRTEITLFHVMDTVPEAFRDWENDSLSLREAKFLDAWRSNREKQIGEFMDWAKDLLLRAGSSEDTIHVKVQERDRGIARDIVAESQKGYDTLVMGRRGQSFLENPMLGSVSAKVIAKVMDIPVWLVGNPKESKRVLVAIDVSDGAVRAIDYTAGMLNGAKCEITLLNVIRGISVPDDLLEESFPMEYSQKLMNEAEGAVRPFFRLASERLGEKGIDPQSVISKMLRGVKSRSGAILEEARQGGYGTIIVGRRGLSQVSEFYIGRVSSKLVQMGADVAVWVV